MNIYNLPGDGEMKKLNGFASLQGAAFFLLRSGGIASLECFRTGTGQFLATFQVAWRLFGSESGILSINVSSAKTARVSKAG